MYKDWFGGSLAAPIGVLFAFAFGLFAGPRMAPAVTVLWIGAGLAVTVFTWWSTALASKESRQARELQEEIKDKLIDPLKRTDNPTAQTILSAAAAKIVELGNQVDVLRRHQQRTITTDQWKTMFEKLNFLPLGERGSIQLTTYHDNLEARRYAQEFAEFLFHLNLCSGTGILDGPPGATGLILRFDANKPRPAIVDRFSQALTRAGLKHDVQGHSFPPQMLTGDCELIVGVTAD